MTKDIEETREMMEKTQEITRLMAKLESVLHDQKAHIVASALVSYLSALIHKHDVPLGYMIEKLTENVYAYREGDTND